jgi:hypothetical protein
MQINSTPNEQQRNATWHDDRLGKFSASQFYRLMTEPKLKADKEAGNLSAGAMTYVLECVAERLTGLRAKEEFTSRFTTHGEEMEPIAKTVYSTVFGVHVVDSQYIPRDDYSGGSPDGLVDADGLVEIKCPYTITSHLEHYLIDLKEKPEYYWQCLGYLLITGRQWIDFVSFHMGYKPKLQMVRKRINRNEVEADLKRLDDKLHKAITIFKNLTEKLK